MINKGLIIILLSIAFIGACSKHQDESPTITIESPTYLQQINGGDTIQVKATITDDMNIEHVTVSVRNDDDILVLQTISKVLEEECLTSFDLDIPYFFDDLHLPAGEYSLKISAFDGINTSEEYVSISYNEIPFVREGVFVLGNSGNFSSIYLLDSIYSSTSYKSITGDFIGAALDSYNQQLINSAKILGKISATDLKTKSTLWGISVVGSTPIPFYTGFYFNDQSIFLGKRNGGVQGYDKNGNPNFSAGTSPGYYMESAFIHNDYYLVMEEKAIVSSSPSIISLSYMASGTGVQQTTINEDVKGMYSLTNNTILLLSNDASNNAKALFYDIPSGVVTSPFNISSLGTINDCIEISSGVYLVATSSSLTYVNVNTFSISTYLSGINVTRIWYDELAGDLFVANGNSLQIYDYNTKAFVANYVHTDPIDEVLFWYNK